MPASRGDVGVGHVGDDGGTLTSAGLLVGRCPLPAVLAVAVTTAMAHDGREDVTAGTSSTVLAPPESDVHGGARG